MVAKSNRDFERSLEEMTRKCGDFEVLLEEKTRIVEGICSFYPSPSPIVFLCSI